MTETSVRRRRRRGSRRRSPRRSRPPRLPRRRRYGLRRNSRSRPARRPVALSSDLSRSQPRPGTLPGLTGDCTFFGLADPRTRALQSCAWRSAASELQLDHRRRRDEGSASARPASGRPFQRSAAYGDRSAGRSRACMASSAALPARSARAPRSSRASSRAGPRWSPARAASPITSG